MKETLLKDKENLLKQSEQLKEAFIRTMGAIAYIDSKLKELEETKKGGKDV